MKRYRASPLSSLKRILVAVIATVVIRIHTQVEIGCFRVNLNIDFVYTLRHYSIHKLSFIRGDSIDRFNIDT